MPTYEYVCTQCGEPLEVVASIHDAALTECPACGGRLRKVFGNVGVVFKGSGFYRTDSRSGKGAKKPAVAGAAKAEKSESATAVGSNGSDAKATKTPAATAAGSSAASSSSSTGASVAASA